MEIKKPNQLNNEDKTFLETDINLASRYNQAYFDNQNKNLQHDNREKILQGYGIIVPQLVGEQKIKIKDPMNQMLDEFNKNLARQVITTVFETRKEIKLEVENVKFEAGKLLKFGKNLEALTPSSSTIFVPKQDFVECKKDINNKSNNNLENHSNIMPHIYK